MNIPEKLKFTPDHEWIRQDGDTAYIGITDYAQGELGDIVFIEIETMGETLDKGAAFGTIEAVKTVSDLYMPVGGEILEVNTTLEDNPEAVNRDPYGDGWLIKIKIQDASEMDALVGPEEYKKMIES